MNDHLSELILGDLIVIHNLLGLEVKDSQVLILSNRIHGIFLSVDVRAYHRVLVNLVFPQLSIGHWVLDINLNRHNGTVLASNDEIIELLIPAKVPGGRLEGPSPDLLIVLLLSLGVLEHPGLEAPWADLITLTILELVFIEVEAESKKLELGV
jgi:hypothetical protein